MRMLGFLEDGKGLRMGGLQQKDEDDDASDSGAIV